jgi:TPP-dependent pyruvate/acetoin dehydrogenase alpha subunit
MSDPDLYRAKEEIEQWKKSDPITLFERQLRDRKVLADSDISRIEADVAAEIEEAVRFAEAAPWEPVEQLLNDVQGPLAP